MSLAESEFARIMVQTGAARMQGLMKLTRTNSDFAPGWAALAEEHWASRRREEALQAAKKALRINIKLHSQFSLELRLASRPLLAEVAPPKPKARARPVAPIDDPAESVGNRAGQMLDTALQLSDRDERLALLEDLREFAPTDPQLLFHLAKELAVVGRSEDARVVGDDLRKVAPDRYSELYAWASTALVKEQAEYEARSAGGHRPSASSIKPAGKPAAQPVIEDPPIDFGSMHSPEPGSAEMHRQESTIAPRRPDPTPAVRPEPVLMQPPPQPPGRRPHPQPMHRPPPMRQPPQPPMRRTQPPQPPMRRTQPPQPPMRRTQPPQPPMRRTQPPQSTRQPPPQSTRQPPPQSTRQPPPQSTRQPPPQSTRQPPPMRRPEPPPVRRPQPKPYPPHQSTGPRGSQPIPGSPHGPAQSRDPAVSTRPILRQGHGGAPQPASTLDRVISNLDSNLRARGIEQKPDQSLSEREFDEAATIDASLEDLGLEDEEQNDVMVQAKANDMGSPRQPDGDNETVRIHLSELQKLVTASVDPSLDDQ